MQRLFDIKKTQLELVVDRGYQIPDEEMDIPLMDLEEFIEYSSDLAKSRKINIRGALSRLYRSENENIMLVFFSPNTKGKELPIKVVRDFIATALHHHVSEAILISDAPLSSKAKNLFFEPKDFKASVFDDSYLTYNPTKHVDTQTHIRVPDDEVEEKLFEMKVDFTKLLIIKESDPICRYYGWSPGDLIEIQRNDSSLNILAPKSINYRIVV